MFHEAFVKLDETRAGEVLKVLSPHLDGVDFSPGTAILMSYDPLFYPGWQFIDVADYSYVPSVRRFAMMNDDKVYVLNWTNEPIYRLNEEAPLKLDPVSVTEYVRFFFTFVRGRHGRFLITETVDDINWKEEPPPAARKAIGRMLFPLEAEQNDSGDYIIKACMMFKDSLFKSDINVKRDGVITISNEELLIEEMPVLDDVFGQ
jgi:hypothetical protein